MTVIIDSDILIEVLRGRDAAILARWDELSSAGHPVLYSPVSVAELWAVARPKEHEALSSLFRTLTCTPIDAETGHLAGLYMYQYARSHSVEIAGALIAASSVSHRAHLWTRNRKHYPMKDLTFFPLPTH